MVKENFEMNVTAEDNAIGIIPGFPWKLQEQVIKTTILFIVGDNGTSQQYFDKFRCMKVTEDPDTGMKRGEALAISYEYFTRSVHQFIHVSHRIDDKTIKINKEQLRDLKLKIKDYIVDLFLKIDKEVDEERKGINIKTHITHHQPKQQQDWKVVGKKKRKNKKKQIFSHLKKGKFRKKHTKTVQIVFSAGCVSNSNVSYKKEGPSI